MVATESTSTRVSGSLTSRERMLRACRGEPVDAAPVWLMRQAGRYLPEYRRIRESHDFLQMCRSPALAAEVSVQPLRRFGMDAVIVFSDILLPLGGLSLGLDFRPGPRIEHPIETPRDLARLDGEVGAAMEPTCEAIRRIRQEVGDAIAVIGFAGAPWTLSAYATEARLSRDLLRLNTLSYREPAMVEDLGARMAEISCETLRLQIEAGADVVQIFDTWAGMLSPARFRRFAAPGLRTVLAGLPATRPPVILFARGAGHLLEDLVQLAPDVVSIDWRLDLEEAAARVRGRVALQGNLDPTALMASPQEIGRQAGILLEKGRKARGHILNLGHGVLPSTPVEGVAAFIDAARACRRTIS